MLTIDDSEIKKLEKDLKIFASKAYPFATKQTINDTAFKARDLARKNIKKEMIIKNQWTMRGIKVDKARTLVVSQQEASTGSVDDYMERQEFGGVVRGQGIGKPIATSASANQGRSTLRTRATTPSNRLNKIRLHKRHRRALKSGMNQRQRIAAQINQAAQDNEKYVYLETKKRKGIYRLAGGKRRPRIKNMIWDLSKKQYSTPKNPWLKPAADEARKHTPIFYRDALIFQLKRIGMLS